MTVRIHELAVPKGIIIPPCEICGNKATTKCEECRVTHYCSEKHKLIDSQAFHRSICKLLREMKTERPVPISEAERIEEKNNLQRKKELVHQLATSNAKKWMLERNFEFAYPSSLIAYNMARDLWFEDGVQVIYPTCLVAEMFLGLGDLQLASDYMCVASSIYQKHKTISPEILSQFQRLKGLVCMALKNWGQARKAFAEFVYSVAIEHGTDDIRISIPYGYLGLALLKLENLDGAVASFHKIADKWMEHLLKQYENKCMRSATDSEIEANKHIEQKEFLFREATIVLQWMYEEIKHVGMNETTDRINFKILCIQALIQMRMRHPNDAVVFKEEALATAARTKMDKAVKTNKKKLLVEVLGEDYIIKWEKKNNRPRTVATKYLEMIKAINV